MIAGPVSAWGKTFRPGRGGAFSPLGSAGTWRETGGVIMTMTLDSGESISRSERVSPDVFAEPQCGEDDGMPRSCLHRNPRLRHAILTTAQC